MARKTLKTVIGTVIAKTPGKEVTLEEFRELISQQMFKESYEKVDSGVRRAVDKRIKAMTPSLKRKESTDA